MRSQGTPISGALLIEKARDFARQLQVEEFDCNESWLMRFKTRHDICNRIISGEGKSVPADSIEKWKNELPSIIQGYEPRDIYNADETGLFWQLLPNKTLAEKGKC